jgi:hypothetical protein
MAILHFEEFMATKREVPCLETAVGFDNDEPGIPGWVYDESLYIEQRGYQARLMLERSDWIAPIYNFTDLEEMLWVWYLDYIFDHAEIEGWTFAEWELDIYIRGQCRIMGWKIDGDHWGIVFSQKDEYTLREAQQLMDEYRPRKES